jgi:hypothetical protein
MVLPATALMALAALLALPLLLGAMGRRTLAAAWLFVAALLANDAAASWHARFVCSRGACDAAPLPDRGFELLGDRSGDGLLVRVVDAAPPLALCALLATLLAGAAAGRAGSERARVTVLASLALVLLARAAVVQATGLPPAKPGNASLPLSEVEIARLVRGPPAGSAAAGSAAAGGAAAGGAAGGAAGSAAAGGESLHDLMFSGHTSLFLGCVLWLLHLHGRLDPAEGWAAAAWVAAALAAAAAEAAGLVAIRIHYSADVLVGLVVAGLAFANGRNSLVTAPAPTRDGPARPAAPASRLRQPNSFARV